MKNVWIKLSFPREKYEIMRKFEIVCMDLISFPFDWLDIIVDIYFAVNQNENVTNLLPRSKRNGQILFRSVDEVKMCSLKIFNFILNSIGIYSKVSNFKDQKKKSPKIAVCEKIFINFWICYSFVIGIGFVIFYPKSVIKLISHRNVKSINNFMNFAYYGSMYMTGLLIFVQQFRHGQQLVCLQWKSYRLFMEVRAINHRLGFDVSSLSAKLKFNAFDLARTMIAVFCLTCSQHLKLKFIFKWENKISIFDAFWYFYLAIFIHLFAQGFALTISRQMKIFQAINQTLEKIDLVFQEKLNEIENIKSTSLRMDRYVQWTSASNSFENEILSLTTVHGHLVGINRRIGKLCALQAMAVLFYALMHIVAQFWFVYSDSVSSNGPPFVVNTFNFLFGVVNIYEMALIIMPCNSVNVHVSDQRFSKAKRQ